MKACIILRTSVVVFLVVFFLAVGLFKGLGTQSITFKQECEVSKGEEERAEGIYCLTGIRTRNLSLCSPVAYLNHSAILFLIRLFHVLLIGRY